MKRSFVVIVLGAGAILGVALGTRQSLGLFLPAMTSELGMGRQTFAFAMAIQNLLWGVFQPFLGMVADRFGAGRVVAVGGIVYAIGLVLMSNASGPLLLNVGGGILIGFGVAAGGFAVVLGAVGRLVAPERRGMALGIASAGGSVGQFAIAPFGQALIEAAGWRGALLQLALVSLLMAPLAVFVAGRPSSANPGGGEAVSLKAALAEAAANPSFRYLTLGFFVCGFQVVFVAVHFPAYLADSGFPATLGATSLALIGFFNIIGTWGAGALGDRFSRKYLLSAFYAARAVVIAIFLVAPKTPLTVMVFAASVGLLWLGTVPLTSGLVAHIFGVRYMGTLLGIVFLSHQLGSFVGVWLGGLAFDRTGSYDLVWWISIGLGLAAALIHLPIVERPLRLAPRPA
ncbi:MAG: MFS transporter [Rhodospirillales bacterium]|nr:MFS transporter [Rhodospirillales bacterium]